eukprot:CAMPEP_0114578474 /NCGR_PEP_ID=MMETSP0125-20121206/3010_1 /TAXON_ID=485358 ORGANISM="Aristerostoma sp., Strain ATCC 50986" /NCGR_SAMPLE_ID=MMETSP0125 /ASSEMBLY_ACC=CAM_ASM_000245 /LENGTH=146 /DNA_ID=CAMNT_0001768573 /DNA_START=8 /DNA_END=448 /DNA_ORIENTATION=+
MILAIGIIALILVFVCFCRGKGGSKTRSNGNTLFVLGECGSGKTSLLYYLETKNLPKTTSSIQENEVKLTLKSDEKEISVPAIDVPGHHHLRNIFFDRITEAKAIILTIDSSEKNQIPGTADYLYKILVNPVYRESDIPILIVLNK